MESVSDTSGLVIVENYGSFDRDTNSLPRERVLHRHIVGMRVDATSYADTVDRIVRWGRSGESRYVCVASVNNVALAHSDESFRGVMNRADLVTPDGTPLVWGLRLLDVPFAERVCGAVLTPILCEVASRECIPVGFYGGAPETMDELREKVSVRFPRLEVAYAWSPPFRPLTPDEDERVRTEIVASGARILFVGLGAPKQEVWMAQHRGSVNCVMVGVGAAFDLLAGRRARAPEWMQRAGLEWCFRLIQEPGRLWKRYLYGNTMFLALFGAQVLETKMRDRRGRPLPNSRSRVT